MSWFARIEDACAAFIERTFAQMFPSDLEPAQIARKLVAVMQTRTHQSESTLIAPSRYTVYVHSADYKRLAPHRAYLEEEWAALLRDMAARAGIRFASSSGVPVVELLQGESAVAGAIEIEVAERVASISFVVHMLHGPAEPPAYRITGPMRVGRSKDLEIFLVDPSVSRHHAVLDVEKGKLLVRDTGSSNGTFVNGERVQLRTLLPGDIVAFGKTEMRVEIGE